MTSLDRPIRVVRVRIIATGVFLGMWAFAISAAVVSLVVLAVLATSLGRAIEGPG